MKRFSVLFVALFIMIGFGACEQKPRGGAGKMHWDRDMCERCKMAVSERKYAVQIIHPKTNKSYKFDDIGCAVLWLEEDKIPWKDSAIIWITDAKTGKWIDAKTAFYADGAITPMAFGFAAFSNKTKPENHRIVGFDTVVEEVFKKKKQNKMMRH